MNSLVDNFLGILRKLQISYFSKASLDGYFRLTSDISLESVPHGATHKKICLFLYDFKNFNKNWGQKGELLCFIVELHMEVSGTLKDKLQAAGPALC